MDSKTPVTPGNTEQNNNPVPYEITAEGSLGLLALGAVGIKAWRKKRDEVKEQSSKKNNP